MRGLPVTDFGKMTVELSDKDERTEISNSFHSENAYYFGKHNRKYIITENK